MSHILIVEDEPTTSWALAEGLADDGFTIDTFRSAEEAMVWLRENQCDLVITDLRLPGMSGLDFARKLRRTRHAGPVLMVTAYGADLDARKLQRAGVVDVFSKPFLVDALRRAVRRALLTADGSRAPLRRAA